MRVQCWPYNDYHKEQEKYYESIQDKEDALGAAASITLRRRRKVSEDFGYNNGSVDGIDEEEETIVGGVLDW